ncbi:RcnB family protein [Aureimonas pseudogalii]|uniref:Ni/Co efflux regulator RcnB n=1 Tax=Aureimonas pseudogalii TaxID=1744844 RepID=A0A7W6H742_9HYPH|nr:RcnB family protein [Aureimonas pseudogalii]MBB3999799.1 Ni/Co efflux regulator RcnB [Aureimonas pseudogalii]
MKKSILTALAFTLLVSPFAGITEASAQSRPEIRRELREDRREVREGRREVRRDRRELQRDRRELRRDRRDARRPAWLRNGGRYERGGAYVSNYRRYGLRAPGRGQRWVRYGNDYILITAATGLIGAIIAGSR